MSTSAFNPTLTIVEEAPGLAVRPLYLPSDGSRDYQVLGTIQDEMGAPRFAEVTNDLNEDAGYLPTNVTIHSSNDDAAAALVALGCLALIGGMFVLAAAADSVSRGAKKSNGKNKGNVKKKVAKKAKSAKAKIKKLFSRSK